MKKLVGVFAVYLYLLTSARANHCDCLENEEWEPCKNPCEPTCQDPNKTPCPTFACTPGCGCAPGTLRDEISGNCVRPQHCPAVCSRNEVPNDCRDECEPTCQNQENFQCIFQNKRCVCQPGFLRDLYSGKCIAPECCPKVCGINEEWRNCSDIHCRRTCQHPGPKPCPKICTPGCSCKDGFIWDENIKQCISIEQCNACKCDENEEWQECSDRNCRQTCQISYPILCTLICIPGCSCKDGYIWDEHYKKCVRRGHCSKVCNEHAKWSDSIPKDLPTCRSLAGSDVKLGPLPKSGCICKKEFVWDELSQKCVRPEDCPKP